MNIKKITDLNLNNDYSNMTIKDNHFHILNNGRIYVYDMLGKRIEVKAFPKNYKLLTFDDELNMYLAHIGDSSKNYDRVNTNYKKDSTLSEKNNYGKSKIVKDIFFDNTNSKYLILNSMRGYSIDKSGNYLKDEINTNDFYNTVIRDVSNNCPNLTTEEVPDFEFTAIGSDGNYKYVAYNKKGSNFISKLSNGGSIIETLYISDSVKINSLIPVNDSLYALGNDGKSNYLYQLSYVGEGVIDPKIGEILDKIISLLGNISISENSIADIIEAEASKIKYVLTVTEDTDKIIEVNNSANEMMKSVVDLEANEYQNLQELLVAIVELEKLLNRNNM